ncbi:MAG: helicase C-terminal domain-containing protein, partial [Planctomycetota bacterium]
PGMTRVIQTAGRVIRTDTDIGFVALLDWRFATESYQACFPRWWYRDHPSQLVSRDLATTVNGFWRFHLKLDD